MQFLKALPFLALLLPAALADFELDPEDIPEQCTQICAPIVELTSICNVDNDDNMSDRDEDLLEQQCVCTNDSFDVARTAALCADCLDENADQDDREDISSIMGICGFSTTNFESTAVPTATPTVDATKPTGTEDLTTTFMAGGSPSGIADDGDERSLPPGGIPTNASEDPSAGAGLRVPWEVVAAGLWFVAGVMAMH